jgi:hypothetical protein
LKGACLDPSNPDVIDLYMLHLSNVGRLKDARPCAAAPVRSSHRCRLSMRMSVKSFGKAARLKRQFERCFRLSDLVDPRNSCHGLCIRWPF